MTDTIDRLQSIKAEIEKTKTDKAKAEGRLQGYLERLRSEFGCSDLESGREKLKILETDIERNQRELEMGFTDLMSKHDFGENI